jgi:hypothetical protein
LSCEPARRGAARRRLAAAEFIITLRGDRVSVLLNGELVIDRAELPKAPPRGPLGLQNHGDPVEFRNLFIKELE